MNDMCLGIWTVCREDRLIFGFGSSKGCSVSDLHGTRDLVAIARTSEFEGRGRRR
jgi:hypothetical protein